MSKLQQTFQPWEAQFDLDTDSVRTLINLQFPRMAAESVHLLHQGWDNFSFAVDDEWIVRFPKRAERTALVSTEIATLRRLLRMKLPVKIPNPEFVGTPHDLFPSLFFGYRRLTGHAGDQINRKNIDRKQAAEVLGRTLSVIHAVPVEEMLALGIPRFNSCFEQVFAEATSMRETVLPFLPEPLVSQCSAFLDHKQSWPDNGNPQETLVHGDLVDEHVFLNDRGQIIGIIDWGDVSISDLTVDFAGLYAWLGRDFVIKLLKSYKRPLPPNVLDVIGFRSRCFALTTYGWSLQGRDTSESSRLFLVQNAFAGDGDH